MSKITHELLEESALFDLNFAKARVEDGTGFTPFVTIWTEKDDQIHQEMLVLAGPGMANPAHRHAVFQMLKDRALAMNAAAVTMTVEVRGLKYTDEQKERLKNDPALRDELRQVGSIEEAAAKGFGIPTEAVLTVCQTRDWFVQYTQNYVQVGQKTIFLDSPKRTSHDELQEVGGHIYFFYEGTADRRKRGVQ